MIECSILRDNDPRGMRLLWSIQQKHFSTCPFGANYLAQFWLRAHLSIRNGFRPSLWRAALFFKELAFWAKSLVVKPVSVYGGAIATDVNPAGVLLNEETREEQRAGYPGKSRQCACRKSVRTRV